MNEIEKMYKLVGLGTMWVEEYLSNNVDTIRIYHNSYNEMIKSMMKKNDWSRSEAIEVAKKECRKEHPPFTAEKQLELIKWLGYRRHIDIDIYNIKGHTIYNISNDYDRTVDEHKFMFDSNTFEYALAGLVNQIYHSLTSEEKQHIKEILE